LRLTGHFLARDAFGNQHRPLPQARRMLYDRVCAMAPAADEAAQEDGAPQEKDGATKHAG
jgi:DNA repair protein RecO (recombination protein O)